MRAMRWSKGVVRAVHVFKDKPRYTVPHFENKVFTSQEMRIANGFAPLTQSNCGVNLVKENRVISSAREESHSASMGILRKNSTVNYLLPLTLNEQEAGLKTRLAKSSKKRPRESNAHITNQQVLAADNTNDDSTEGIKKENFGQSSKVNAKAQIQIARNEDLPFTKSSHLWKEIDSLEVFRMMPQNPHFSHLMDCNEDTREGMAMGHMWNFASLVEKVSKLKIEDPRSLFQRYLEALVVLETVGFDVKAVVDRINELLAFKTKQEQLVVELSSIKDMFKVKAGAPW